MGKTDTCHGGVDPGATYKDIEEAQINLEISKILKQELEKYGAKVLMTREDNYDLSQKSAKNKKRSDLQKRASLINESMCDLFLSIHLNSDKSSTWYGSQIFYTQKNKDNKVIAKLIQDNLKENTNTKRTEKQIKNTYLFERITRPGVLIEVGFISNENERNQLINKEYQQKIATLITESSIKYLLNK